MGYDIEFEGKFFISPQLKPHHLLYLQKFSMIRHLKRDSEVLSSTPDPLREAVGLPIGEEGEFFVNVKNWYENNIRDIKKDKSIIDFNLSPSTVPSSFCQWIASDDGKYLHWYGMEKFYHYVEWLEFLINNFFKPWDYTINGSVKWQGENLYDTGTILVVDNQIGIYGEIVVNKKDGSMRKLRVFLCYANEDKNYVKKIYDDLETDHIEPWMDEEDLMPGQNWEEEIEKAVENSDLFIACLSGNSIDKVGYLQKEIKFALDIADLQPEGRIFIIPLKLEECNMPKRLRKLQWLDFFEENGYYKLLKALAKRSEELSS